MQLVKLKYMEVLQQPFPWYLSGFLIGLTMLILVYIGKTFGMSSNLKTLCGIAGADKVSDFFADWRDQKWNLLVVVGAILGGFVGAHFLDDGTGITISQESVTMLAAYGIDAPHGAYLPDAIFSLGALTSVKSFLILLGGGVLIGFGTRYAGGCTSGHAITGLSNFQLPSLIAVVGFFIGGLTMVHLLFPFIFGS